MEFLFHSVYDDGHHRKYFNVYRVEENRFLAELHHFNPANGPAAGFELQKKGDAWIPLSDVPEREATYIGEEIQRSIS